MKFILSRCSITYSFLILCILASINASAESSSIPEITQQQFDQLKLSNETVFIAFHTSWCSGCRAQHKSLSALLPHYKGQANVYMLNWDNRADFNIPSPLQRTTIVVYKKGEIVDQLIGTNRKNVIQQLIDKHLK